MRAHIIENDLITNTIEVESLDFMPNLVDASIGGVIGWSYKDGQVFPPVINLDKVRKEKLESIKSIRDNKIQTGGYKASNKWFHSDTVSRSQQIGLVLMGQNIPVGLMWKTMDGSFIEMTPTVAHSIFQAAANQDSVLFNHAELLRQQVDTSETPWEIDVETGWPETFQATQV